MLIAHVSSGASVRQELARAPGRLDELLAPLPDGQDPHRHVGGAGVGERPQPALHVGFRTHHRDVADVGGVTVLEQALVVRRVLGVTEDAVGALARRVDLVGAHRPTGTPATTRGEGRPAFSAAFVIRGTTCSAIARSSAIQSTVPSVRSPAIRSITGPSAASSTGVGATSVMSSGLWMRKRSFSTSTGLGPANMASNTSR